MFNCEVADASVGIEYAILSQSGSGTGFYTFVAVSTGLRKGLIRGKRQIGNEFAEQRLQAQGWIYQHVVFADKAYPGPLSQGTLGNRGGIDTSFEFYFFISRILYELG